MEKYERLTTFLKRQLANEIRLTFADLQDANVVGIVLPSSTRTHRQWWDNQESSAGRQCQAWLSAGWSVRDVKLGEDPQAGAPSRLTRPADCLRR